MYYWAIYLLTVMLCLGTTFNELRQLRFSIYIFTYFLLLFFVGFRYESTDYLGYLSIWSRVSFENFGFPFFEAGGGTTGNEFLFATIISAFKIVGLPFESFLFLISVLSLSIKFYYFKKLSPYFLICIILYFSMGFFKDLGQVRNALAASILLLGLEPLHKRRFINYLLVVFVAFGIHSFAIIALPIYWCYPLVKKRYIPYFVLVVAFFISFVGGVGQIILGIFNFISGEIPEKVYGYFYSERNQPLYYHAQNLSFFVFSLIFLRYKERFSAINDRLISLVTFHFYSVVIYFLFFDFSPLAGRIFELLSFNSVIILLSCMSLFFYGYHRVLYFLIVMVYSLLLFWSVVGGAAPYQNIFI